MTALVQTALASSAVECCLPLGPAIGQQVLISFEAEN
jgi:hypothetical protein